MIRIDVTIQLVAVEITCIELLFARTASEQPTFLACLAHVGLATEVLLFLPHRACSAMSQISAYAAFMCLVAVAVFHRCFFEVSCGSHNVAFAAQEASICALRCRVWFVLPASGSCMLAYKTPCPGALCQDLGLDFCCCECAKKRRW